MFKIEIILKNIAISIWNLPRNLAIVLIRLYQFILSPDHSWVKILYPHGYCRHYPTCSEFSKQAFTKFGMIKGLWLSVIRVIKCNPWTEPKVDLITNN